jgi:hypothetical protein
VFAPPVAKAGINRSESSTKESELAVGHINDPLEHQADAIADRVLRMPEGDAQTPGETSWNNEESAARTEPRAPRIVHDVLRSPGEPLAASERAFMEPRFGYDFSSVRVHADAPAQAAASAVNAMAYTVGSHLVFASQKYAPHSRQGQRLLAHELAHVVQQSGRPMSAPACMVQRKEVDSDADVHGAKDWTKADRENGTQRWKDACLANLNAVDSSQYVKVVERRDFYKWFYEYAASLGYSTRWALAAYVVANGAHQIADMDMEHAVANDVIGLANVELQGAMREGNQIIFDNVLPKLKKLIDGGPLTGPEALKWDVQVLAEEQMLVQPMYKRMSKETIDQLDYIARKKRFAGLGAWKTDQDKVSKGAYNQAGTVPGFDQPDIQNVGDRWKYGMELGNTFAPGGTGYTSANTMPAVGAGYKDGSELAKVDVRAHLHELDAWLNPNRVSRTGGGSDIRAIIAGLTELEKGTVLSDRSADGWAYSIQFGQFTIDESTVRGALPSDPSLAAQVNAFLIRFRSEVARVNAVMQKQRLEMMRGPKF